MKALKDTLVYKEATNGQALAEIRAQAMQPSLEALGRFNPERVRQRFLSTYTPTDTTEIWLNDQLIGFYVLRNKQDHLYLDHLYLLPSEQGKGIGKRVLNRIKAHAQALPIKLGALRNSPANTFYQQNGFRQTHEDEFDLYYCFQPS